MKTVTRLSNGPPDSSERNLIKIIEFLGGRVKVLEVEKARACCPFPADGFVISSAEALARFLGINGVPGKREVHPFSLAERVLVYGFRPTLIHNRLLQRLTGESLVGVERVQDGFNRIKVAADKRDICRQLSGLAFDAQESGEKWVFAEGACRPGFSPLISLEEKPLFVQISGESSRMMLWAVQDVADLDAEVRKGTSILRYFSNLVPVIMFLRSVSETSWWHNESPSACFIVDDPPLKSRYGFLDYEKLLTVMKRERFCTSIAFIPWNFKRSQRALAEKFAANPRHYSLCVHGCDHTWGEFGPDNQQLLQGRAQQALARMALHQQISNVPFDKVMVFPQGIFSTAAIRALRPCGYLAAVNTTPYPANGSEGIKLRELLQPAVTCFSNFPLFTRRPGDRLAELALDLFVGKPALIVAHHDFFRHGYDRLVETVRELGRMDERLRWNNLATICSETCLKKVSSDGEVQVQFFTDSFRLRNRGAVNKDHILVRRSLPEERIKAIAFNGQPLEVWKEPDVVKARISLGHNVQGEVKVDRGESAPACIARRKSTLYRTKVFLRRTLTEFRDNYVSTSRSSTTARQV